jgi:hypothetical protein
MNRMIWLYKFAAILTLMITLSANVPAERYIFQDGWSLDMNESTIGNTVPARFDFSYENGTICWLISSVENTNATFILVSWTNDTNLQTALAEAAVMNSQFGRICNSMDADSFKTISTTKASILGEKQLMEVRAYNKNINETRGFYVPLAIEDGNYHYILALGATNITSEQWNALLTSVSLNRPSR